MSELFTIPSEKEKIKRKYSYLICDSLVSNEPTLIMNIMSRKRAVTIFAFLNMSCNMYVCVCVHAREDRSKIKPAS